jgi:hypothetical protein
VYAEQGLYDVVEDDLLENREHEICLQASQSLMCSCYLLGRMATTINDKDAVSEPVHILRCYFESPSPVWN